MLKRHKSAGTYQIPEEVIKVFRMKFCSDFYKFINSTRNKNELPDEWKDSIFLPINK
jgi:hypothetical protein